MEITKEEMDRLDSFGAISWLVPIPIKASYMAEDTVALVGGEPIPTPMWVYTLTRKRVN